MPTHRKSSSSSASADTVVIWGEPLAEFFPRNGAPGSRYFWRNRAEAESVAQQKAAMLARSLQALQSTSNPH